MLKKAIPLGIIGILALTLVGGTVIILARPYETDARAALQRNANDGLRKTDALLDEDCAGEQGEGRNAANQGGLGTGGGRGEETRQELGQGGGRASTPQGQSNGRATAGSNGSNVGGNGGPGNQGSGGPGTGNRAIETENEPIVWTTITGSVLIADSELTVETETGEILVGLGQSWYREEQGFTVRVGDEVRVEGYEEDGEFKAGTVENLTTGATITLRDASGRPMWAGQGERQQQGVGLSGS